MRVQVATKIACPPERVWSEILTTRLLRYVCSPLVTFQPLTPKDFPTEWSDGDYLVGMRLFGLVPFGQQHIVISRSSPTANSYMIRDNGYGDVISRWDHRITIRP